MIETVDYRIINNIEYKKELRPELRNKILSRVYCNLTKMSGDVVMSQGGSYVYWEDYTEDENEPGITYQKICLVRVSNDITEQEVAEIIASYLMENRTESEFRKMNYFATHSLTVMENPDCNGEKFFTCVLRNKFRGL